MLCGTTAVWPARASILCRIARRSSPRWRALQYATLADGETATPDRPIRKVAYSPRAQKRSGETGNELFEDENTKSAGTVTTSEPHRTSIDSILEQLPRNVPQTLATKRPVRSASLTILLTPTYAKHALDESLPLKVVNKLCGPVQWSKPVHTVTAVVDRIPDGNTASEGLAFGWRHRFSPVKTIVSDSKSLAYELREMAPSAQKPGWLELSFSLPVKYPKRRERMLVQLPLARTIFSNGLVSTLVHRIYHPDDIGLLRLEKQTDLESSRIDMTPYCAYGLPRLHSPLVPLTPARQIKNVMGNIIRTVSAEPSFSGSGKPTEEAQPASEELEQAVTTFFAANNIQPQPVSVWALIIPSPLSLKSNDAYRLLGSQDEDIRALWTSGDRSSLIDTVLPQLIRSGARLRKVLSGGGGWGKKAGLLSLDPDDRYSTRELRQDAGWEININDDPQEQQRQALGEAAKKGESVMFFLAPEGLDGYEGVEQREAGADEGDLTAVIGALPSSIDTAPTTPSASMNGEDPVVKYHPNVLGAFSEEGLALGWKTTDGTLTNTKFDVPYSRMTCRAGQGMSDAAKPASGRKKSSTARGSYVSLKLKGR